MAEITWKNIDAPSFSEALTGIGAAAKTIGSAGEGLRNIIRGVQETGEKRYDTQQTIIQKQAADYANQILDETGSHEQAQAAFNSRFSELGGSVEKATEAGTAYGKVREQEQALKNKTLVKSASNEFMKVASETGDTKAARNAATRLAQGNPEVMAQLDSILNPVETRMNTLSVKDQADLAQYTTNVAAAKDLKLQQAQKIGSDLENDIATLQSQSGLNPELYKEAMSKPGGVQKWAADLYEDSGIRDSYDSIVAIRDTRKKLAEEYGEAKADVLLFSAINSIALDRYGRLGDAGLEARELEEAAVKLLPVADKIVEKQNRYQEWKAAYEKDVTNIERLAANDIEQARWGLVKGGITGQAPSAPKFSVTGAGLASSAFATNAFDKYRTQGATPKPAPKPNKKASTENTPPPKETSKETNGQKLKRKLKDKRFSNFGGAL